jgi:hypothetical protein
VTLLAVDAAVDAEDDDVAVLEAELELEEELDEHAVSASAQVPASTAIRRTLTRRPGEGTERIMAQSVNRPSVRGLSRS